MKLVLCSFIQCSSCCFECCVVFFGYVAPLYMCLFNFFKQLLLQARCCTQLSILVQDCMV